VLQIPYFTITLNPKNNIFPAKSPLDFTTVTGNYFVGAEMELLILTLQTTASFPHLPKNVLEIKESIFNF